MRQLYGISIMWSKFFKKGFDISLAFLLCVLFSWLILIIWLLVRIFLGSPAIFKQPRVGYQEKIFTVYKFRTMTNKKDVQGNLLSDDLRLTRFGKFLRASSLDELPQLFNILKGDMSFVGPRPPMKRIFDLFFASLILVLMLPFCLCAAFLIKLSSEGPILFISQRVGKEGVLFDFLKFRTMNVGAPLRASHDIDAIQYLTRIGKFLRKTSLDELPQLWNVIRGDMSLVGPRPVIAEEIDLVNKRKEYGVDKVLPGITGWAQVNGRDHVTLDEKVRLDCEYIQRQSLWFDFKIVMLTIWKVLFAHDIKH